MANPISNPHERVDGLDRRSLLSAAMLGGTLLLADNAGARPREASYRLSPDDFAVVVEGLEGAEGVAVGGDGSLYLSNARSAIARRTPDGVIHHIGEPLAQAGVALDAAGRVIVANVGLLHQKPGPLQRVDPRTGAVETLVAAIEGRTLVASNYPVVARDGTIYCTHTSWGPVANIGNRVAAGFIYMVPPGGEPRIVARDLHGPNGCCFDINERYLYVAMTPAGRVRRFPRHADGSLGKGEDYGPPLGVVVPDQSVAEIRALPATSRAKLGYCDGVAFDKAGNLWVTLPFANRLVAITPPGALIHVVHDPDGRRLSMPTNLAWGGRDRRDLYVVSRLSGMVVTARTPVAGIPLAN